MTAVVVAAAVLLVAVSISPFVVIWLGLGKHDNWLQLSQVGQSYGVASAAMAALALCVVSITALIQARQARATQAFAARHFHLDLLKLSIERPEYRAALGSDFDALGAQGWPIHAYLNLWMMYLQTGYLTGAINTVGLRRILADEIFSGAPGRDYWTVARSAFVAEAQTHQHDRFVKLVDREFTKMNSSVGAPAGRAPNKPDPLVADSTLTSPDLKVTQELKSAARVIGIIALGLLLWRRAVRRG